MRLGLIGLGRIGAFHANTLVGIPAIDSLVVTDIVPDKTKQIVDRFASQGVEGVDSLEALLSVGGRRRDHRGGNRRAPETGSRLRRGRPADAVREAGRAERRRRRGAAPPPRGLHRAGADRLPAPLRRGHRRGPGGRRQRRAGLDHHDPVHHPGPGAAPAGVRGRLRRDVPRLRRARLRHHPVGHRPGGRRGLRHRQQPGRGLLPPSTTTSTPPPPSSPSPTARSGWCPTPATTAAATTSGWRFTARRTASPPASTTGGRSAPTEPGVSSRPDRRTGSSWTASCRPSGRSSRRSSRSSPATRPSPCTVADGLEADWIAEACAQSLKEHRPVRIEEVRIA